jgi:hypothetical protein
LFFGFRAWNLNVGYSVSFQDGAAAIFLRISNVSANIAVAIFRLNVCGGGELLYKDLSVGSENRGAMKMGSDHMVQENR